MSGTSEKLALSSSHQDTTAEEKAQFYNSWAQTYDQDVVLLDYRAPRLATDCVSSHFSGDCGAALVLDVACGTGLVAKEMKKHGFGQFWGIDASDNMLELARKTGWYKDLKLSMLGEGPLPYPKDFFDVSLIVGALSNFHVKVAVVREMCKCTKPGGYICMTTRISQDNLNYKGALESELKKMEDEGLWSHVEVTEVKEFVKTVSRQDVEYDPGTVYLYRKTL